MNAPWEPVAAAEHAMARLLLARSADASVRVGEWTRSRFMGVELNRKTLGSSGSAR
ncbi:MAG: hypothetical protein WKH64_10265 [Chloroflexia bacterium]